MWLSLILLNLAFSQAAKLPQEYNERRQFYHPPPSVPYAETYINTSSTDNSPVHININTQDKSKRNATSPNYYGIMHEDISHSGDGGIYAEMIINRAFQGTPKNQNDNPTIPFGPTLTGWRTIGNCSISLDRFHPLSSALPTSLQLTIGAGATGEVGIINEGWWGMEVSPQTYSASFYVSANQAKDGMTNKTTMRVSLRDNATLSEFSGVTLQPLLVDRIGFSQVNTSWYNTVTAPTSNNSFAITMNATEVQGQIFYFNLVSLFPETFKNRKNGMRKDLAGAFYDAGMKTLRFPGGNALEGLSVAQRFKWWETIGPLIDRPGRIGNWGYYQTNGLGLMEYLLWCEDANMEPILGVYAGYSIDFYGGSGTDFPQDQMDVVLQEALSELEFIMGDSTSTYWGKKRAEYGHPDPFSIKIIEIGNEDWFSATYPRRFKYMYEGLKAKYPDIRYISSAFNENKDYTINLPDGVYWDAHNYQPPSYFLDTFNKWDNPSTLNLSTNNGILLGEFSVFQHDTPSGGSNFSDPAGIHIDYPNMISAVAEGVYLLSGERNPNFVKYAAYAPILQNRNSYIWTPNFISFAAGYNETVLSTSYWMQSILANHRGSQSLPAINDKGHINPLYWASDIKEDTGSIYFKVINTGNKTVPISLSIDASYAHWNGTILQNNDPNAFNYVNNRTAVMPQAIKAGDGPQFQTNSGSWNWTIPVWSVTVLQFDY